MCTHVHACACSRAMECGWEGQRTICTSQFSPPSGYWGLKLGLSGFVASEPSPWSLLNYFILSSYYWMTNVSQESRHLPANWMPKVLFPSLSVVLLGTCFLTFDTDLCSPHFRQNPDHLCVLFSLKVLEWAKVRFSTDLTIGVDSRHNLDGGIT